MIQLKTVFKTGLLLLFLLYWCVGYAQQGKTGSLTITSTTVVKNEYTSLTSDAHSGATSITVNNSGMNAHSRFLQPLGNGDLVMIIQMQGATINGTATDSTWGTVTNYNNCGLYEFLEVTGTPSGTTININCSLKNNYTAAGKVQIVRIPRYTTLTINAGGVLTADPWDGTQGGIVAVEVQTSATINNVGGINLSGLGFRGGMVQNSASTVGITDFVSSNIDNGAQKGESIAGYQSDYNAFGGMFCRGAPANGGGGGDSHNAAGGGGANGGDMNAWTGNGNPDITTNLSWASAWNLEYSGFATSTSSGGGRGGNTWCFEDQDALTVRPGDFSWQGDFRRNVGGKGGRPLDYSTGRLFFGGGGGAGQEDNSTGGAGGAGGGLVYILSYGTVSGSGSILSNGQNGADADCSTGAGDPPGGGGAGGTIIINSTGTISGISATANGGKGGSQVLSNPGTGAQPGEAEGGAGGGSGGYIATSNGAIMQQALGGVNGTSNSSSLTEFIPDGGTKGGDGTTNASIDPIAFSSLIIGIAGNQTICIGQSAKLNVTGGDATDTYSWTPSTGLDSTNVADPIATPTDTTKYIVTVSNGTCTGKDSVTVNVLPKVVIVHATADSICPQKSVALDAGGSSSYIFSWLPTGGLSCTDCSNPVASPSANTTYTVIATNQYCSDTGVRVVVVLPLPTIMINDTTICYGQLTQLYPHTNGTLSWSPASYLSCTNCNNPQITPLTDTIYTITATLGTCITTENFTVIVDQPSVFAGVDTTIYKGSNAGLHGSGLTRLVWSPSGNLSASDISNPVASPSVTTTYTLVGFDSFGCSAISSVVVFVKDPCEIPVLPNAFSPNNDGKNDVYKMINPFVDKLVSFRIYNRWGQLVFETTDLNVGWDGRFNGQPEGVGAYVYYLEVICQGATISYKGNVTLLR